MRTTVPPSGWRHHSTASMKVRMKRMPRPDAFSRFCGSVGSATRLGSKPSPRSRTVMTISEARSAKTTSTGLRSSCRLPCRTALVTASRTAIKRLIEEGKKKILLNLGKVSYVDSSGIGELVSSFTTINREGGQLKLLNLSQKIQDLMTITKLHTVFDVYDDETAALNSYK